MSEGDGRRYDAFISYSREDASEAALIQRTLHRFGRPRWLRLRPTVRTFRDTSSLAASPELWSTLFEAMTSARYLIVLLSPAAAASSGVDREIRAWLERRDARDVLLVLLHGELEWSATTGDFASSPAVPPALAGVFEEEPAWVDLTWAADAVPDPRDPRLLDAAASLLAAFLGRPKDRIIGDDVRARRRAVAGLVATVVVLALLAAGAGTSAVIAVQQREEAQAQAALATSRQLAADSELGLGDSVPLGALLAVQSRRMAATAQADAALFGALTHEPRLRRILRPENRQPWSYFAGYEPWSGRVALIEPGGIALQRPEGGGRTVLGDPPGSHPVDRTVAFTPDGRQVVTADTLGRLTLRDAATGRVKRTASLPVADRRFTPELEISPSGKWLVVWEHDRLTLLDARDLRPLDGPVLRPDPGLLAARFDPAERYLVTSGLMDTTVYEVGNWRRLADVPVESMSAVDVAFSPDGRRIALVDNSSAVVVDTANWRRLSAWQPLEPNAYVGASSPDSSRLFVGGDGGVSIIDPSTGVDLQPPMTLHPGRSRADGVNWVYPRPDGSLLAVGDDGIVLWDPNVADPIAVEWDLTGATDLAFAGTDGQLAATGPRGLTVLTNPGERKASAVPGRDGSPAERVAASRDGTALAAVGRSGVWVHDRVSGSTSTPTRGKTNTVFDLSLSSDGSIVAAAEQGQVTLWNASTMTRLRPLLMRDSEVADTATHVEFLGATHVLVGGDGGAAVWDVAEGSHVDLRLGAQVTGIGVTPRGDLAVVATGDRLAVVDPERRAVVGPPLTTTGEVRDIAVSADGHMVAGAVQGRLEVWDLPSRRRIGGLSLPETFVVATNLQLEFDPTGRRLVAVADGHMRTWDMDPAHWQAQACRMAGRDLTRVEWTAYLGTQPFRPACTT